MASRPARYSGNRCPEPLARRRTRARPIARLSSLLFLTNVTTAIMPAGKYGWMTWSTRAHGAAVADIVVADLEASLQRCIERGGSAVTEIKGNEGEPRYCVIRDPAGAVLAPMPMAAA